MARGKRSNPLALVVLTCLFERPMHPYEISQTLRTRHKDQSVRLNFGSLYGVVASLERRKLITVVETVREGRRPERTIYDLTERGKQEMTEWLADLVGMPTKEYLQFEAGLSLLHALPPDEALALLRQRSDTLRVLITSGEASLASLRSEHELPRIFLLENEYQMALQKAELAWVKSLVEDMENEQLEGMDSWAAWHAEDRNHKNEQEETS